MGFLVCIIALTSIGCSFASPVDFEEFDSDVGRIANGINATGEQFLHAISLQFLSPTELALETRGHTCGGALVSFQHAVTSASCLHEEVDGVMVPRVPTQYRVFAGHHLLTNDTVDRVRMVHNFTIHPGYTGAPAFVNDIAIITLMQPFAAATVRPLTLPAANFNPIDFTLCQVAGWGGQNETQTGTEFLQFSNKYIYNQNLCSQLYNSQPYTLNIKPTMVCAASFNILQSGCINDDGNALICGGTYTGVLFVHDHCRSSSYPELYTRVSNYSAWITSITVSSASFTSPVFFMTIASAIAHLLFNKR